MGAAKKVGAAFEDLKLAIEAIAVKEGALVYADEADDSEASPAEDPAADMYTYAAAFADWRDGKIEGTADDIFEATKQVLNPET